MAKPKDRTAKLAKFVEVMLISNNATQAAIAAGYSKKTAGSAGNRLLKTVEVQQMLKQHTAKAVEKIDITAERVLKEMARIAFFDIRKLFGDGGRMLELSELDDDTAAAIASVDVDELFEGFGEGRTRIGYTKKYKTVSKLGALQTLMEHLGMLKAKDDKPANTFNLTINLNEPRQVGAGENAVVINNNQGASDLPMVRI